MMGRTEGTGKEDGQVQDGERGMGGYNIRIEGMM